MVAVVFVEVLAAAVVAVVVVIVAVVELHNLIFNIADEFIY